MAWAKRITLFIVVNLLVITTISFLLYLFNVQPYLNKQGLDIPSLMVFCLIWGMGGAFISLALSKIMAKWMMGVRIIDPTTQIPSERSLVQMVYELAEKAGLPKMPEVGIYQSPEVNAFATGPSKSRALVAVSSGLLQSLGNEQVKGVLGHEVTHIANGDMVTMTLLQGIVNAFVMFLARVVAFVLMRALSKDRDESVGSSMSYQLVVIVLQIFFMVLGSMVIASFSRYREFRADAGGARLAGRDKMISALRGLQRVLERGDERRDESKEQPAFQAFKISGKGGMMRLFSSHPPLEERISRLEQLSTLSR